MKPSHVRQNKGTLMKQNQTKQRTDMEENKQKNDFKKLQIINKTKNRLTQTETYQKTN